MGERIKCKKCGDILQSKYRHDGVKIDFGHESVEML